MLLPLYPKSGTETIINLPGHYKGYFSNYPPTSSSAYKFRVADNWKVISCIRARGGSHGGCPSCVMILIELKYIEKDKKVMQILPVITEIPEIMILTQNSAEIDYCGEGIDPMNTIPNMGPDIVKGSLIGLIVAFILYLAVK